jgi:hypothetical protein
LKPLLAFSQFSARRSSSKKDRPQKRIRAAPLSTATYSRRRVGEGASRDGSASVSQGQGGRLRTSAAGAASVAGASAGRAPHAFGALTLMIAPLSAVAPSGSPMAAPPFTCPSLPNPWRSASGILQRWRPKNFARPRNFDPKNLVADATWIRIARPRRSRVMTDLFHL